MNEKEVYLKIPLSLITSFDLTPRAVLVYGELSGLYSKSKACFISDKKLASRLNCKVPTIQRAIKQLKDRGLIESKHLYHKDFKGKGRQIIVHTPIALTKKYIEISEKDGEKQAKKIIGYSFEEIKSIPFSANVYTLMMKNMEKNLIAIGKSKGEFKSLEININSPEYLCGVLKELSPYLYQMDKNYRLEFNGFLYAESFNSKYEPFNFAVSQNSKDIRTLVYTDKNERGIFR